MSMSRWFASPLAGTLAVVAGLVFLSVPLRHLTSREMAVENGKPQEVVKSHAVAGIPAVLSCKVLSSVKRLSIRTQQGGILLERENLPAGESEYDVEIPLEGGQVELFVKVCFENASAESALFLTVLPDGYEGETCYMIGAGETEEVLRYDWKNQK